MQKLGKFWVTLSFCAAQSSYCYLRDSYHTSHKDFWISGVQDYKRKWCNDTHTSTNSSLLFPRTSFYCIFWRRNTKTRVSSSVIQELQSSEDRGTHASSCPSHKQRTIMSRPSSFIQPSENLLRCSRFAEYSRKLVSCLSFAFRSQPCGGEP